MRQDVSLLNRAVRRDVFISSEQWAKIESSIRPPGLRASSKHRRAPPQVLPEELRQEICNALLLHKLMSTINYYPEAQERRALKKLYQVPKSMTLERFPNGGESDSRRRTEEVRHVGSDIVTPGF